MDVAAFAPPLVGKVGPTRLGALSRIIGFTAYSRSLPGMTR
jgi:hypothetical protein